MSEPEETQAAGRGRWGMRILKITAGLLVTVVVLVVLVALVGVRVPIHRLSGLLGPVVEGLGAEAEYSRDSYLEFSLNPAIRLEEFRLSGPRVTLSVGRMTGRVELVPLFQQQLVIREATLDTGRLQWVRPLPVEETVPEEVDQDEPRLSPWLRSLVVDAARVTDVQAVVRYDDREDQWAFSVVDLNLAMPRPGDVSASIGGSFLGHPFTVAVESRRRGPEQWGLERLEISGDGGNLLLTGQVDPVDLSGAGLFRLTIEDSDTVRTVLGPQYVGFTPVALKADWDYSDGIGTAVFEEFRLGTADFNGNVGLDVNGPRLSVNADLESPRLDLESLFGLSAESPREGATEASPPGDTERQGEAGIRADESGATDPPLAQMLAPYLEAANLDLAFRVGSLEGAAAEISDVSVGVELQDGALRLPVAAILQGVPLQGSMDLKTEGKIVRLDLPLEGPAADMTELLRLLLALEDIEGRHEGIRVTASAAGITASELVGSLTLSGSLAGARIRYGTRPVEFSLNELTMAASTQKPTSLQGRGELLGQPFELALKSDGLAELADADDMYLSGTVTGRGTKLEVSAARSGGRNTLDFGLDTSDPGILRNWLGLTAAMPSSVELSGGLIHEGPGAGIRVRLDTLRVGRSAVRVEGLLRQSEGRTSLSARIRGDQVDAEELRAVFASPAAETAPPEAPRLSLDAPILPAELTIVDADLDIALGQLINGDLVLRNVQAQGRTREDRVERAAVRADTAYGAVEGVASADFSGPEPSMQASLQVTPFQAGRVLMDLEIVEQSELVFDRGSVELGLAGSSLSQWMDTAQVDLRLEGGRVILVPELELAAELNETTLHTAPGEPVILGLNGLVGDQVLETELRAGVLRDMLKSRTIKLDLDGRLGSMGLEAGLNAPLPLGAELARLNLAVDGESLDALEGLFGVDLPPWGPVALSGNVLHRGLTYRVDEFHVAVGTSELEGRLDLDLEGKPRAEVVLSAPLIQLEDFRKEGWTARGSGPDESAGPASQGETGSAPREAVLSRSAFESLDATLAVDVGEVRSGADKLGAGELRVNLLDGILAVPTLLIQTPGGDVTGTAEMSWAGPDLLDTELTLSADRFDYGVLARRIDPASTMKGSLSVYADLKGRHPAAEPFLGSASGELGFGVWPEDFRSGVFDLWAVGLVSAVMPKFSDDAVSTMNCMVGRFGMDQGRLTERAVFADSSRIQVTGEVTADFSTRQVDAYLVPRAKRAQIFSFAAPVEVTGSFDEFDLGFRGGDLALATVRFITSPVVAPVRWLAGKPLPKDGEAACRIAWEGSPDQPAPKMTSHSP